MLTTMRYSRFIIILSAVILSSLLFIECINNEAKKLKPVQRLKYEQFAGSVACSSCHKNILDSFTRTAHFLTSQPAEEKYIKGSFEPGKNTFIFNPAIFVSMEKRNDRFYQVAYAKGIEKLARPFDIVVGSGKRGQTFLYWDINKLYQLPISYFTSVNQWSNSPGYANKVIYKRPITSRCLECHSTYFQKISDPAMESEEFSKTNIVYGVSCERCHGPGAEHVEFHQQNPNEKIAHYILNPKTLSRQQSLDMCRVCHGGKLTKSEPSFSFKAGDTLSKFFSYDTAAKDVTNIDVHGNQYGLLSASKCFKSSQMTCGTCHSPHENETGNKAVFSQHCMSCHNTEHNNFCKIATRSNREAISKNCIDCHMPEQSSKAIMVLLEGQNIPTSAVMRSHFISVYPEETKKFLSYIKQLKSVKE